MTNEFVFNVNTDACVVLVNRLEQLHKSALPLAIRGTLNAAAFDVKQRTLEQSADKNFIRRSPTFFKRFSGVNRAQGWNIESMQAAVGMTPEGGNEKEYNRVKNTIANFNQQEEGGKITEGLDYLKAARSGGSYGNRVLSNKRWDKDKRIKGPFTKPGTTKSRVIASAYMALKLKEFIRVKKHGINFYVQVNSITRTKKGKVKINSKLLYMSRTGNIKPVPATHFSREAANNTIPRIRGYFNVEAQKQIARLWK